MARFSQLRRNSVSQARKRDFARGAAVGLLTAALLAGATIQPIVPDSLLRTILGELSVDNSMKQTAAIASHARYPNSQGFFDAAEYVAARAREYGLQNVHIEHFPQSQPMWDQAEAELSVVAPVQRPIETVLAQHSADADLTAQLADSTDSGLRGKVVLTDREPEDGWRAVASQGAAAVISAASGEYFGRRTPPDAILWSMVGRTRAAFMISPKSAGDLRSLLQRGPVTVHLHAKARRTAPGAIGMVMGEIPGNQSGQDVVIAAHLDHQFPGANDNASGAGTLLELARTANRLI